MNSASYTSYSFTFHSIFHSIFHPIFHSILPFYNYSSPAIRDVHPIATWIFDLAKVYRFARNLSVHSLQSLHALTFLWTCSYSEVSEEYLWDSRYGVCTIRFTRESTDSLCRDGVDAQYLYPVSVSINFALLWTRSRVSSESQLDRLWCPNITLAILLSAAPNIRSLKWVHGQWSSIVPWRKQQSHWITLINSLNRSKSAYSNWIAFWIAS